MARKQRKGAIADVRTSVKHMRTEARRLAGRIQRDVRTLALRSRSEVVRDVGKLRNDFRVRAKRALRDLEARRTRVLSSFEKQVATLSQAIVRQFHAATQEQMAELARRVATLEQRAEEMERRLLERA